MAVTLSNRREGVSIDGKRSVTLTAVFTDGTAVAVTKASLGLHRVDAVYVRAASAGTTGVDFTSQDATNVNLDPVAAATVDLVFVGY